MSDYRVEEALINLPLCAISQIKAVLAYADQE
jgi:hypothetical protein